jgi:hypothetical protein
MEIVGSPIGVEQGARGLRPVLVEHRQRDVAHVVGRSVAQQKQLHHRHDEGQGQCARVAEDLDELLADHGE